jgi:hypothetical protein
MTEQETSIMDHPPAALLRIARDLALARVPVLPLRRGKVPFGNCHACRDNRCGGRPNMKTPGGCRCPEPCHAWAAATTEAEVITSPAWARAWRGAVAVAYHPGGAGVTVVDLDNADAVAWARQILPPTKVVATTRGEHWIYLGTMPSANGVRPGVDIKSRMAYVRWLGTGDGTMTPLPEAVTSLPRPRDTEDAPVSSSSVVRAPWTRQVATGCRHTEGYVRTGLERGKAMVRACRESGAGSQAFGVARFLGSLHAQCPGPCGLQALGWEIVAAAVSVGVPEPYAVRAVTRGFDAAGADALMQHTP